jgi:hydroxyacylglutathione hydrolase
VWPKELAHLRDHGHFDAGTATAEMVACGCAPMPAAGAELWSGQAALLRHGQQLILDGREIGVLHTPGHTPGGVCLLSGKHLFGGDTLFPGGPGLTGWPLSDFGQIVESLRTRLFTLPDDVQVHPGHGRSTTIGAERPQFPGWIERGW